MTCTLNYRRTPDSEEWSGGFKLALRDLLHDKFGVGTAAITPEDINYLRGVQDAQFKEMDKCALQEIIDILQDGGTVDLSYDC